MNIVLIGFRGTGKSTVGRLLANRLERDFVDSDKYIESATGKTIKSIFEEDGEESFRKIEADTIAELSKADNKVISAGGGAVLKEENVRNLKDNGFLVLLEATPEIIHNRITQDEKTTQQRPSLTDKKPLDEIKHLIEQRKHAYKNAADFTINTSYVSCEDIVSEIIIMVNKPLNK
ncbi:MAG: shikimate kinase [Candidatus Scalindua rubra]|uniref:Shikimate kinase n=1 Tax=Candidatus Scalindua brodae TaxID=237368 RepID=A0A0B0EEC2_9BACT|nr:MAG: shikimate kinase [Candidatus Scalindua brodae]MBZ0109615.1 shikimate kinase [Candidatus Scalindua rubra]TWU33131.1 Shikimate kinase [Candidatus Brocadiaceae bacterium S225]